ncbi:MAG: type I-E CRISPR-associated protein Cse1/CasA [Verrucomicrobiota bacterium]|nr:type I-E CRISPR-associated protein Cse1/CasA [Verrucomicrobiota bacterium]
MNLVNGDWIPVIFEDGKTQLVSLGTLYEQADKISDLVLTPPQRISIMRLLICITQAALDGPENEAEWLKCENRIIPESINYLKSRINKFNLYDDKQPFMQVLNCEKLSNASCDKLDFGLAAGNNPTLFDHKAASGQRKQSDAWIAVMLISYQNFLLEVQLVKQNGITFQQEKTVNTPHA